MGAGVSEAVHQLLGARSSVGSKGPGEVAKVMEVEIFDANLGAVLGPGFLEDVRGERAAFLAGEDVALGGGLSEHLKLMAQIPVTRSLATMPPQGRSGDGQPLRDVIWEGRNHPHTVRAGPTPMAVSIPS